MERDDMKFRERRLRCSRDVPFYSFEQLPKPQPHYYFCFFLVPWQHTVSFSLCSRTRRVRADNLRRRHQSHFQKKHNVRRSDSASHTWSLSQRSRKRPLFSSLTICTRSIFRGLFAHGRFSSVLAPGRFFDVFSQTVAFSHKVALQRSRMSSILYT